MATCRSCNAPIVWCTTEKGGKIPMDAKPSDDGNMVIVNGLSRTPTFHDVELPRYKSHFATCPNAKSHRKQK